MCCQVYCPYAGLCVSKTRALLPKCLHLNLATYLHTYSLESLLLLLELTPSYCRSCCTNGLGCVCHLLVAELTWCDITPEVVLCEPRFPWQTFPKCPSLWQCRHTWWYFGHCLQPPLCTLALYPRNKLGTNWWDVWGSFHRFATVAVPWTTTLL